MLCYKTLFKESKMKKAISFILIIAIAITTSVAKADFTFGKPINLDPPINSPSLEASPFITSDGLELYFCSDREGGIGGMDLWMVSRPTIDDQWGSLVNLGEPINSSDREYGPYLSTDGLTFYFASDRPGTLGDLDLWVTTRTTVNDPWAEAVNLGPLINSSENDSGPSLTPDGLSLFFYSRKPGGFGGIDIWVTTRATVNDPWAEAVNLGPTINTSVLDYWPSILDNGLTLILTSRRPGGYGNRDIWLATRETIEDEWGTPINVGLTVNSSVDEACPNISNDDLTLYFASNNLAGQGSYDIWQASVIPIVDLNNDRVVDSADMCMIVDHWGEDYSLCDIGPSPRGDGIVDVQDLIVLAEHLFEDYRLITHWKLDETEGTIAYDSVDVNDGILNGDPIWQPIDGKVGGALKFDGIDDYLSTPFLLNPGETSFSILAWIKGGAPGQVIVSQADDPGERTVIYGSTWLGTDPTNGRLMTGLMDIYFGPLESELVITDGQWHHIGLVYDIIALKRHLYVDGVEVIIDAGFIGGVQSSGGLYICAGQDLGPDSFFSGLIDDVRIYDVALSVEEIQALKN
jgi:hypothetical protein